MLEKQVQQSSLVTLFLRKERVINPDKLSLFDGEEGRSDRGNLARQSSLWVVSRENGVNNLRQLK